MDLTNISTEDLTAFQAGDLSKVSTEGLRKLQAAQPPANPNAAKIDAYLAETDTKLGLPPGTSARQINQESQFNPAAVNQRTGATGLAQVMPTTAQSVSNQVGRQLDPSNVDDALFLHRYIMAQNLDRFGTPEAALRAYNSGWSKAAWNNPETNHYIATVLPSAQVQSPQQGPAGSTVAPPPGTPPAPYTPWGPIQENVSVKDLSSNQDWLSAARQMYNWDNRKAFTGSDQELSDWAANEMSWSGNNAAMLASDASRLVANGTQDDMRAYLHGMQQWDAASGNLSSFGSAVLHGAADPINLAGMGTLGAGTLAKIAASAVAKEGVKKMLIMALGRTGISAGIAGAISGATRSVGTQTIQTGAGAQDGVSVGRVALDGAVGGATGVVLGTAGDALLSVAVPAVRKGMSKVAQILGKDVPAAAPRTPPVGSPGVTAPTPQGTPPVAPADASMALVRDAADSVGISLDSGRPSLKFNEDGQVRTVLKDGQEMLIDHTYTDAKGHELTAYVDGKPIGTLGYGERIPGARDSEPTSNVIPEFRRKGVMTALFNAAEDNGGGLSRLGVNDAMRSEDAMAFRRAREAASGPSPVGDAPHVDPTVTEPINITLTADEMAGTTQRAQMGRVWTDDLPSVGPQNERPFKSLVIPELEQGLRDTATNQADLAGKAEQVAAQLRQMSTSDLRSALEVARTSTTLSQSKPMFMAGQILHNELRVQEVTLQKQLLAAADSGTPDLIRSLQSKLQELQDRLLPVAMFDDATGSYGGSLNRQRQTMMMNLEGKSVAELMQAYGLTRAEAVQARENAISASELSTKAKTVAFQYDTRIADALANSDTQTAVDLLAMKRRELNAIAEEAFPATGPGGHESGGSFLETLHHGFAGLREGFLSNLFTIKTVAINAIAVGKTLALPSLHFLVNNPLERGRAAELAGTYAGMRGSIKGALAYALNAYKYEQAILTKDSSRLMDGELMLKGNLGGAIRFFPRVLNASDEFLAHLNYMGYVSGKAAFNATIEGQEKGMSGRLLSDYVKNALETAKHTAFEAPDDTYLQPIVNKGVNLGYTGQALQDYVEKQAADIGGSLQHGADKSGLDYARDVLYKRPFTEGNPGDGWVKQHMSATAATVEGWMRKAPEFSLLTGQLFFRTPVRVFEEAIRLTPGYQLIAPGFMRDLIGTNGTARQVRAQAEALTATAIAGAAMSLYAQGKISASGVYMNPQQSKNRLDGPGFPANTIHSDDGTAWNFNSVDAIAVPMKIWINAFEGWDELRVKEAQEQYINQDARRNIIARISVGTMAMAQAIMDSNLMGSVKRTMDLGKELADPEGDEAAIIKSVGKELGMIVPNTMKKLAQQSDPRVRNPATWAQAIESGLGMRTDVVAKTSFAYDPLGEVRTAADIGSLWSPVSKTTTEQRERGYSPEHASVMSYFDHAAQIAGTTYSPIPVKNQMTGQLDLRTMMTEDGKETLYDRWNRNYRDLNPAAAVLPLTQSQLSDGTYKYKGAKPQEVQSVLSQLQQVAFMRLLTEEKVQQRMVLEMQNQSRAHAGLMDFDNRNK